MQWVQQDFSGYDQHRRSNALCWTACSALPDENRTNLYAVNRQNMSMALLLRRPARRTRGGAVKTTCEKSQNIPLQYLIFSIYSIFQCILHILFSPPGLGAAPRPGAKCYILLFFSYFIFFAYKGAWGSYSLHIHCIFIIFVYIECCVAHVQCTYGYIHFMKCIDIPELGTNNDISFWMQLLIHPVCWPVGWDWLLPVVCLFKFKHTSLNSISLRHYQKPFYHPLQPAPCSPRSCPQGWGQVEAPPRRMLLLRTRQAGWQGWLRRRRRRLRRRRQWLRSLAQVLS